MSEKLEAWTVPADAARIRADRFLSAQIPGQSRSQIQRWIRKGQILVNGKPVKTGYLTQPGDRIVLSIATSGSDQVFPERIPLDILYEDSELAVINKPAGMVCHAGAGIRSGTLVNALLYHTGPIDAGDPTRPGIVHRLDKFTSGVMLVAKNNRSHEILAQQFKNRQVEKEYLALVYGRPVPTSGTIDLPLGRDPHQRRKISTRARRRRSAITHYQVAKNCGPLTLLKVRIETGRTHQIRVHLAQKGHPIVGDNLYGGNRRWNLAAGLLSAVKKLERPFLHSHRLQFRHPQSGEMLSFTSSLPNELDELLSALGD